MKSLTLFILLFSASVYAAGDLDPATTATETPVATTAGTNPNIHAGNFQVGGGFSYTSTGSYSSTYIAPSFSYFVVDNFSLGLAVEYSSSEGDDFDMSSSSGMSPKAAYYFGPYGAVVPSISLSIDNSTYKTSNTSSSYTYAVPSVGVLYFISSPLAFGVEYRTSILIEPKDTDSSNTGTLVGSFSYFF